MTPGLVVVGAGRLGQAVLDAAAAAHVTVHAVVRRRVDAPGLPQGLPVFSSLDAALQRSPRGVVLDVSLAEGAASRVVATAAAGWPLVEGVTALDKDAETALAQASARVAVVVAPNLSPGAALLLRAARALSGPAASWDAGILDRHHAAKRDAPSGTARALAAGFRPGAPVPIVSLRQGGVVGEHTLHLAADDEELALTHRVLSRRVFARGALLAARFAASAPPGRYAMEDVLGE